MFCFGRPEIPSSFVTFCLSVSTLGTRSTLVACTSRVQDQCSVRQQRSVRRPRVANSGRVAPCQGSCSIKTRDAYKGTSIPARKKQRVYVLDIHLDGEWPDAMCVWDVDHGCLSPHIPKAGAAFPSNRLVFLLRRYHVISRVTLVID